MIFNDGECPICIDSMLHLNTDDLMECPKCNLMMALSVPMMGTILKKRGRGLFRFEDCHFHSKIGLLLAKSSAENDALPMDGGWFHTINEIKNYLDAPTENTTDIAFNLWFDFQEKFKASFAEFDSNMVKTAWASKPTRTEFYKNYLMPSIASKLKLAHGKEEFNVDYVMSKPTNSNFTIPQIYIESENDIKSASHEIRKLSSLNSPLRVLLTIFDAWENENDSKIFHYLRDWQNVIKEHWTHNSYGLKGTISIVIGSRVSNEIIFRSFAFWANGYIRQPLEKFYTHDIQ